MDDLPFGIQNFGSIQIFDQVFYLIDPGVNLTFVISHHRKTDFSPLQQVVVSHLRNGDIEFIFSPINNLLEGLPFSLKRIVTVDSDVQLTDSDYHKM